MGEKGEKKETEKEKVAEMCDEYKSLSWDEMRAQLKELRRDYPALLDKFRSNVNGKAALRQLLKKAPKPEKEEKPKKKKAAKKKETKE